MNVRFADAVDAVLAHRRDRGMLVGLAREGQEMGYDELRQALGDPLTQGFQRGLDRLIGKALVKRRLVEHEEGFRARFSLTQRGSTIAHVLTVLGSKGTLPSDLSDAAREAVAASFLGRAPTPVRRPDKGEISLEGPDAWQPGGRNRGPPLGRGVPTESGEPFTPRTLREALLARIEGADPEEPVRVQPADEVPEQPERRFLVVPTEAMAFAALKASADDATSPPAATPGQDPHQIVFLEHGFTHWAGPGLYRFVEPGPHDEGLRRLAERADHVHFWDAFEPLSDAVVEWALL